MPLRHEDTKEHEGHLLQSSFKAVGLAYIRVGHSPTQAEPLILSPVVGVIKNLLRPLRGLILVWAWLSRALPCPKLFCPYGAEKTTYKTSPKTLTTCVLAPLQGFPIVIGRGARNRE
jgi:hypothetical protein